MDCLLLQCTYVHVHYILKENSFLKITDRLNYFNTANNNEKCTSKSFNEQF